MVPVIVCKLRLRRQMERNAPQSQPDTSREADKARNKPESFTVKDTYYINSTKKKQSWFRLDYLVSGWVRSTLASVCKDCQIAYLVYFTSLQ